MTLALGVVIAGLVGGAMRTYGLEMGIRDLEMRRTHLATQLLAMIEQDLVATVRSRPIDNEPLNQFLLSSLGQDPSASTDSEDLSAAGVQNDASDPLAASDPQAGSNPALTTNTVLTQPGLIGNQNVLQIDISRLPRIEEYAPLAIDPTKIIDIPSDLKTVTYLVQTEGVIGGVVDPLADWTGQAIGADAAGSNSGGGLVRRLIDRATTLKASNDGAIFRLNASGQIIAPEVVAIEFRYFDGLLWIDFWDSDQNGSLPIAIEITLTIRPVGSPSDGLQPETEDLATYRHLVRLPMANLATEDETVDDSEDEFAADEFAADENGGDGENDGSQF